MKPVQRGCMQLFDRLGVRHLAKNDAEPACIFSDAEKATYMVEVRREMAVTVTAQKVLICGKNSEIFCLRAEPYMGDFRPVSFKLFDWHYQPDYNAISFACASLEMIRASRIPDFKKLLRRFPLKKSAARIKLVYSRDKDAV